MCSSFHLENTEFGSEQPIPVKAKPSLTDLHTHFSKRVLIKIINNTKHNTSVSVPNVYELPPLSLLDTFEISPAASEFCRQLQILAFSQSSSKKERSIQPYSVHLTASAYQLRPRPPSIITFKSVHQSVSLKENGAAYFDLYWTPENQNRTGVL